MKARGPDSAFKLSGFHVSRHWPGTRKTIEEACPCPKESCGCVDMGKASPDCDQHTGLKTMRQGHSADECPGADDGE